MPERGTGTWSVCAACNVRHADMRMRDHVVVHDSEDGACQAQRREQVPYSVYHIPYTAAIAPRTVSVGGRNPDLCCGM